MKSTALFDQAVLAAAFFTSDSRLVSEGSIFVALKGSKVDGHDFVPEILAKNPVAVIVNENYRDSTDPRLIFVHDTAFAHREIAGLFRKKFRAQVIAVGGSNGKTSTKDFLVTLLGDKFRLIKTDKSQNGELGIPKTLEKLRADTQVAVIEVGIDGPGDMIRHAEIVQPDLAILTSIGEEHLNLLKTVENVFKEEKILFDVTLARGGKVFAPANDVYLRTLQGTPNLTLVAADTNHAWNAALRWNHPYARQNALLAATVAQAIGLSENEILLGFEKLELPEGRGREMKLRPDLILIADHYNANPASMRAGLENVAKFSSIEGLGLRLILGDMFDLGEHTEAAHESLLATLFKTCPSEVLLVGEQMAKLKTACESRIPNVRTAPDAEAAAPLAALMAKRSGIIFIKGSRGMALEKCLAAIAKENPVTVPPQK